MNLAKNGFKVCTVCSSNLPVTSFRRRSKSKKGKEYFYWNSSCKSCDNTLSKAHQKGSRPLRNSYKARKKLENPLKFHVQERISQWRSKDPVSDLTTEYLIQLFENQDGLCYYTRSPMIIGGSRMDDIWSSMSLDRLDPELGYKQGNVVWCLYRINHMKNTLPYDDFIQLVATVLECHRSKTVI